MPTIESTTSERLRVPIISSADPTGAAVEFQLSTGRRSDPDGTWVAGSWLGSWDSVSGRVTALTPLIGDLETMAVVEGETYDLFVRWTADTETPVKRCPNQVRVL